jgi:hypothetical protein
MKIIVAITLLILIGYTKSKTQYQKDDNSKLTVNDRKSVLTTIVSEILDTLTRQSSYNMQQHDHN